MAYCTNCGKTIEDEDRFCHACGTVRNKADQAQAAAAPMPPGAVPYAGGQTPEEPLREQAERRVKERMELLQHIGAYVIVNGFLVVIWAVTGADYPWFIWPMIGWGIGLAFHVWGYFMGRRGTATRDRMVAREIERMRQQQGPPPPAGNDT